MPQTMATALLIRTTAITRAVVIVLMTIVPSIKELFMKTHVSNEFRISSIAMYRPGCSQPERLHGNWTIQELSVLYPTSVTTGVDTLLYGIPDYQHSAVTIEFTDSTGAVLPHDPRIFLEDTELLARS